MGNYFSSYLDFGILCYNTLCDFGIGLTVDSCSFGISPNPYSDASPETEIQHLLLAFISRKKIERISCGNGFMAWMII